MSLSYRRVAASSLLAIVIAASPVTMEPTGEGFGIATAEARENVFERMSRSIGDLFGTEPAARAGTARRSTKPVAATVKPRPRPVAAAVWTVSAIGADAVRSAVAVGTEAGTVETAEKPIPSEPPAADVVAVGLTADDLVALVLDGWDVLASRPSRLFGANIARLKGPAGLDLKDGIGRILALSPDALVAENRVYRVPPGTPCAGPSCDGPAEGAGLPSCPSALRIGIVGARPDLNVPGLDPDRIDLLPTDADADRHPGSPLIERLAGSDSAPGRLPGAVFVVRPVPGQPDIFALLAALDEVAAAGPDLVVIEADGDGNPVLADAIARLADDDVPTVGAAPVSRGATAAPASLMSAAVAFAAIKAARPYLNVAGLSAAVAARPDLDRICRQTGLAGGITLAGVMDTSSSTE